MKPGFITLIASLLSAVTANARNPEPLRATEQESPLADPVRRVVLVHGFLETGSAFSQMKRRLEKQGVQCLIAKLRPSDGRGGLDKLAEGLKRDIDATYGPDQTISVIGFSMGGVVSRYYLQKLGGAARCEKFFTISSPHHGTLAAKIYPTKGAVQMRPDSEFLKDLAETDSNLGDMPVVSYRTPLDLIILPPTSSVWDRAVNIEHPALLHPLMVTSNTVISDIEKRLLE
jgi:triacylglycerol lipase